MCFCFANVSCLTSPPSGFGPKLAFRFWYIKRSPNPERCARNSQESSMLSLWYVAGDCVTEIQRPGHGLMAQGAAKGANEKETEKKRQTIVSAFASFRNRTEPSRPILSRRMAEATMSCIYTGLRFEGRGRFSIGVRPFLDCSRRNYVPVSVCLNASRAFCWIRGDQINKYASHALSWKDVWLLGDYITDFLQGRSQKHRTCTPLNIAINASAKNVMARGGCMVQKYKTISVSDSDLLCLVPP